MSKNSSSDPLPPGNEAGKNPSEPARRRSLWIWFAAGFFVVFVGMLFLVTMISMHPSGEFVVRCTLWQYYFMEIDRAINATGNLGPGSGSSSVAIWTAFQHVLFSAAGGAFVMGIGWGIRRIRNRKDTKANAQR